MGRSSINGEWCISRVPVPPDAAQARASNFRLTRSSWRTWPHLKAQVLVHPSAPAAPSLSCAMEDVLEVYQRQPCGHATEVLVACLDETSKQQVKETRQPRPAQSQVGSYDYEYERNGVSNLFMLFATAGGGGAGWKWMRTGCWAQVVKQLLVTTRTKTASCW